MSLKSSFQQSAYQQALKRFSSASGGRKALNLREIERVAIIFNIAQANAAQDYATRLRRLQKKVSMLGYTEELLVPEGLSFDCFCKKDTNWANVPKSEVSNSFLEQSYDLLVTLHIEDSLPLDFILQASKSKMRVGYYRPQREDWYDLMVHNKQNDLKKAGEQIQKYLNWINR